ncbi:MAG: hypothetical protein KDA96_24545, partial [Planctomycetaceae bacterium]|nr:hypothetical protein [Planctomycetaceae bacterium]
RSHVDALMSVSADSLPADSSVNAEQLQQWKSFGQAIVEYHEGRDKAAFDHLMELMRQLKEYSDEEETYPALQYLCEVYLTELAVSTGEFEQVMQLLELHDPIEAFAWQAANSHQAERLEQILNLATDSDSSGNIRPWFTARLLDLQGRNEEATAEYIRFVTSGDRDYAYLHSTASLRIARSCCSDGNTSKIFERLPPDEAFDAAARFFRQEHRWNNLNQLLDAASQYNVTWKQTLPVRCSVLDASGDVDGLCELFDEWSSRGISPDDQGIWDYQNSAQPMLIALLLKQRISDAQRLTTAACRDYDRPVWDSLIALAGGDTEALRQKLRNHNSPGMILTQLLRWPVNEQQQTILKELRREFPVDRYSLPATYSSSSMRQTILLTESSTLTGEEWQSLIQRHMPNTTVSMLDQTADDQRQQEAWQHDIRRWSNVSSQAAAAETSGQSEGAVQHLIFTSDSVVIDVMSRSGTYGMDVQAPGNSIATPSIRPDVRAALESHHAVVELRIHHLQPGSAAESAAVSLGENLASAILRQHQTTAELWGSSDGFVPVNPELINTLSQSTPLPARTDAEHLSAFDEESVYADSIDAETMRRDLRRVIRAASNDSPPEVRIWIAGLNMDSDVPLPCRLIRWTGGYVPDALIVELPDSPAIPTPLRGEYINVSIWAIVGWATVDSAAEQTSEAASQSL